MSDPQIERLKKLPKRSNETWQGGWVRAPGWVAEGDEEPHRLWIPFCVSVQSDTFGHVDPCRAEEKNYAKVLTALVRFACDDKRAGCRPGRLEVNDSAPRRVRARHRRRAARHKDAGCSTVGIGLLRDRLVVSRTPRAPPGCEKRNFWRSRAGADTVRPTETPP